MPLVDANGKPLGKALEQAQQAMPQSLGFAILKRVGHALVPMQTPNGDFAIIPNRDLAVQVAGQQADLELRPQPAKDGTRALVAPQQKSSEYFVVNLQLIGKIQAQVKNPEQLLAPGGKHNA